MPYLEPYIQNGGCGKFGFAYGEFQGYYNMSQDPGCNGTNAWGGGIAVGDAWDNLNAGYGVGPGGYWDAGGPGVDPNYNGTTSEAMKWGNEQGAAAVANWESHGELYQTNLPIGIDVEDPNANAGWNESYPNCSGSPNPNGCCSTSVARATFNGIWDTITGDNLRVLIYSSEGDWTGIFGTGSDGNVSNTAQWAAHWGHNCGNPGPTSWTQSYDGSGGCTGSNSPGFFGGVSSGSACAFAWQWSGGSKDYDQVDGNRATNCN